MEVQAVSVGPGKLSVSSIQGPSSSLGKDHLFWTTARTTR